MSVEELNLLRIEQRVRLLDISLFNAIISETSPDDRRSMLAIHAAVSSRLGSFTYLEIGSHLGGSIPPFLLDPRCNCIVSVDKRPSIQPDERGTSFVYPENSTKRMLQLLSGVSKDSTAKIVTFDKDSSELTASMIPSKINLCFIDGEHTNAALQRDFWFCESVISTPGVIYLHDSDIVFEGIDNILQSLRAAGRPFHAYNLPAVIFVIDLGMNIHEDENIRNLLAENHLGYISALKTMAPHRKFYNKRSMRLLRKAYQLFKRTR